jgi:hypothetical protein
MKKQLMSKNVKELKVRREILRVLRQPSVHDDVYQ